MYVYIHIYVSFIYIYIYTFYQRHTQVLNKLSNKGVNQGSRVLRVKIKIDERFLYEGAGKCFSLNTCDKIVYSECHREKVG